METALRTVYLVLLILALAGWLAAHHLPAAPQNSPPVDSAWRRTARGWESPARWFADRPAAQTTLHPAVVASFQLMLSTWGLVIAQPRPAGSRRQATTCKNRGRPAG